MLNFFLGSDVFREGIREHLDHFKFEVSTVVDFWNTFQRTAENNEGKIGEAEMNTRKILPNKFEIQKIMEFWTNQNGLPLISVKRKHDSSGVTVQQVRVFLQTGISSSTIETV